VAGVVDVGVVFVDQVDTDLVLGVRRRHLAALQAALHEQHVLDGADKLLVGHQVQCAELERLGRLRRVRQQHRRFRLVDQVLETSRSSFGFPRRFFGASRRPFAPSKRSLRAPSRSLRPFTLRTLVTSRSVGAMRSLFSASFST